MALSVQDAQRTSSDWSELGQGAAITLPAPVETPALPASPVESAEKSSIRSRLRCRACFLPLLLVAVVVVGLLLIALATRSFYAAGGDSPASNTVSAQVHFHLRVTFCLFNFAGFNVALMCYNGSVPGPTLVASPGSTIVLSIENALPQNRKPVGTKNWPCWHPPQPWPPSNRSYAPHAGEEHGLASDAAVFPNEYINVRGSSNPKWMLVMSCPAVNAVPPLLSNNQCTYTRPAGKQIFVA